MFKYLNNMIALVFKRLFEHSQATNFGTAFDYTAASITAIIIIFVARVGARKRAAKVLDNIKRFRVYS